MELLEQTHFPLGGGPNWTLRIVIFALLVGAVIWVYFQFYYKSEKSDRMNNKQNPQPN